MQLDFLRYIKYFKYYFIDKLVEAYRLLNIDLVTPKSGVDYFGRESHSPKG
jgi:hypothetical protein